jgi:hypothetical protein
MTQLAWVNQIHARFRIAKYLVKTLKDIANGQTTRSA